MLFERSTSNVIHTSKISSEKIQYVLQLIVNMSENYLDFDTSHLKCGRIQTTTILTKNGIVSGTLSEICPTHDPDLI